MLQVEALVQAHGDWLALLATILERERVITGAELARTLSEFAAHTAEDRPAEGQILSFWGAPQGLSYGQRQSEQMVNKSLSVAAKYIKFRGFVRLDELEVTGSPLVMFHPRSS